MSSRRAVQLELPYVDGKPTKPKDDLVALPPYYRLSDVLQAIKPSIFNRGHEKCPDSQEGQE